jgi:hypothetical protein
MEVDFAILADGVAQRPDGKLDLFGAAFDNISAAVVPAMHPSLSLAMRIFLSRHEAQNAHVLEVILMSADGVETARARADVNPIPQERLDEAPAGRLIGVGSVLQFANLVFPDFGIYHFAILWDGNEARSPIALALTQLPQEA